jgi:hypothetical protein
VISGASISIISVLLFAGGLTIVRHVSRHNIWGWAMFGPALLNVLAQIGVLAYVQIVQGQHPEATSTDEIKYVNGSYDTDGKLYTREGWACSMDKLYHEREGDWATKACSNLVRIDNSFSYFKIAAGRLICTENWPNDDVSPSRLRGHYTGNCGLADTAQGWFWMVVRAHKEGCGYEEERIY